MALIGIVVMCGIVINDSIIKIDTVNRLRKEGYSVIHAVLQSFDTAILLNQQSVDKFEAMVKPGGLMIYDPNGITRHPERDDIRIFQVEAAEEAARMKSPITFNMVVLGAYIKVNPVVNLENVIRGLRKSLPDRHHHLIPVNEKAILRGMEIVKAARLTA